MEGKKVVLIGIGNCGNQVANLGEKKYPELFDCIYINTSDSDLSMVTTDENSLKYKIGDNEEIDVEGSGKNRNKMKQYLRGDIEDIIKDQAFRDIVSEKKYGIVIVSSAGGSGSGAGPVFTNLVSDIFPDTNFILVGVLPKMSASLLELCNTLEFLDELYHKMNPGTTYAIYDNDTKAGLPITVGLEAVNDDIIEDIRILTGVDNYPTPYESIDDADMESIVSTPGRIIFSRIPSKFLTEKCLEDGKLDETIIKSIKESSHAETDRDRKVVRWGLITYFNDAVNKLYSPDLEGLEEFLGTPIEKFNHNALNSNSEKLNFMHLIASGLSPINDRVAKIAARVEELKESLSETTQYILDDSEAINKTISGLRKNDKSEGVRQRVTIDDAFSKFM